MPPTFSVLDHALELCESLEWDRGREPHPVFTDHAKDLLVEEGRIHAGFQDGRSNLGSDFLEAPFHELDGPV